jgi:hypothetical protein
MVARDRKEECGVWRSRRRAEKRRRGGEEERLFRAHAMNGEEQVAFESRAVKKVDSVRDRATPACRRGPPLHYPTTHSPCFPVLSYESG